MENKICMFTGHRSANLPWGYKQEGKVFNKFKKDLIKAIKVAIKNGYNYFISGMALGFDMLAADMVLKLKKKFPQIKLECAIPCTNQTAKWNEESIKEYERILKLADKVVIVSPCSYYNGCMKKRNEYMIDKSELVISCFNGKPGGTAQTLRLALDKGKRVVIIKTEK